MNSVAFCVIITRTQAPRVTSRRTSSAALYAAIPPLTPTTIVLSLRMDIGTDSIYGIASKKSSGIRRRPLIRVHEMPVTLAFEFAGDKPLHGVRGDIVGNLARRMFHRVRRDRIERPADLAIARQLEAPDRIDHDSARVGRILHRHPQLEFYRDTREALALDPEEADLIVILPRDVIRRPDVDVNVGH